MSIIRRGVGRAGAVSGCFWDALTVGTRWNALQIFAHTSAFSQCVCLSSSPIHSLKALEKRQQQPRVKKETEKQQKPSKREAEKRQQSPIEREATELSNFIETICKPNILFSRPTNAPPNSKQIANMNFTANGFLDSLNLTKNNVTDDTITQFSNEVYKMSNVQLIELLSVTYKREIDHPLLLKHICTALNDLPLPSSLHDASRIAYSLSKHSFLDKPLLNRIKEQFVLCAQNEFISDQTLTNVASSFAFFRLTDRRFWQQIIRTTEALANRSQLRDIALAQCVNSLAAVNVQPKLLASLSKRAQNMKKRGKYSGSWLKLVHSLAILNSINARMVESVLNQHFIQLLSTESKLNEHITQWTFICLRNIATSALLELPKDQVPPIDNSLLADPDPKAFSLVHDIKRGDQMQHPLLERFELMLRLVAPLNTHSTAQEWHKTGAFLEGRCFVDTAQHQLVPLRDVQGNSNAQEVAVILLMDRHLTQGIGPAELDPDRPTGINQMNIRHLKLAGIHPIVFTERHFRKFGNDERSHIKFIREKILTLSEEFHHNEWQAEE